MVSVVRGERLVLSGERQESGERVVRSERSPKSEGRGEGEGEGKRDDPHVDKCPVHRALRAVG